MTGWEHRCKHIFTPSNGRDQDSRIIDCRRDQQNNAELQNYTVFNLTFNHHRHEYIVRVNMQPLSHR